MRYSLWIYQSAGTIVADGPFLDANRGGEEA
jgi:hypothetical protein